MQTYRGTLKNDHISWDKEAPSQKKALNVCVTVLEEEEEVRKAGKRMSEALEQLSKINAFSEIKDPKQWQREIRRDRPLFNYE